MVADVGSEPGLLTPAQCLPGSNLLTPVLALESFIRFPFSCRLSGGCHSSQLAAFSRFKKGRVDKGLGKSMFSAS